MKKLLAIAGLASILVIFWGCKTTTPVAVPQVAGCSCTAQALGNNLVASMMWTNPATGQTLSGSTISIPASGGNLYVYSDPSISCTTNQPIIVLITWVCKTNPPVSKTIQLPPDCNGFVSTIAFNCLNCDFFVSQPQGFSCSIMGPRKK